MSPDPTPSDGAPKTAVVFVHGMRTSSAIWERQVEHVRDAGHAAVAVDLPAHGARRRERFSMPGAFEVIDDAVASFGTTPVAMVGLSLGGYTSLAWAARAAGRHHPADGHDGGAVAHEERLAGVVAVGCSSDPKGKPVALFRDVSRAAVAGHTAARRAATGAAARWRDAMLGAGGRPGGIDVAALTRGAPTSHRPGWDVVTDSLTHLVGRSSVANLRALRVPVWLVNGSRDTLRLEEQRHLAAATHGSLVVVPGAGHDVNTDAPEAFNRVLTQALADFGRA
jgi:pimeloyl-ACP methyl ester carboxylesterase